MPRPRKGRGLTADIINKYKEKAGPKRIAIEMRDAPPFTYGEDVVHYQYRTGLPMAICIMKDEERQIAYNRSEEGREKIQRELKMNEDRAREASLTPAQRKKREEATAKAFIQGAHTGIAEQTAAKAKGYIDTASNVSSLLGKVNPATQTAFEAAKMGLDVGYNLMGIDDDQSNDASTGRAVDRIQSVRRKLGGHVVNTRVVSGNLKRAKRPSP